MAMVTATAEAMEEVMGMGTEAVTAMGMVEAMETGMAADMGTAATAGITADTTTTLAGMAAALVVVLDIIPVLRRRWLPWRTSVLAGFV